MAQKKNKQVGTKPRKAVTPQQVFKKISEQTPLTKEENKYLDKLIKVLEKAFTGKKLNESDRQKINDLRAMRKLEMASFMDYMKTCASFLHLLHLFDKT